MANTLNTLKMRTRKAADHLALNPTATMPHAPNPMIDTNTRPTLHCPWMMNPKKRKISKTRPARRKLRKLVRNNPHGTEIGVFSHYFFRSFSLMVGSPANGVRRVIIESLKTMNNPPMTLKLRKKKLRSKIRP